MSVLSFASGTLGHRVTSPGGLGGQCVDLVDLYLLQELGKPQVQLNAVDWVGIQIPGMEWVKNEPNNYPPIGAIVVWGRYAPHAIGVYGHVAVALVADGLYLVSLDQNWPEGAPVSLRMHDYGGVLGWHQLA